MVVRDDVYTSTHIAKTTPQWQLVVTYVKAKFMPHVVYSLPTVIFDEVAKSPDDNAIDFDALNPWDETITLNAVEPAPFDFSQVPSLTFFEVIEAKPENRYHLPLHHLDRWIDSVHAMRRKLIAQDASWASHLVEQVSC